MQYIVFISLQRTFRLFVNIIFYTHSRAHMCVQYYFCASVFNKFMFILNCAYFRFVFVLFTRYVCVQISILCSWYLELAFIIYNFYSHINTNLIDQISKFHIWSSTRIMMVGFTWQFWSYDGFCSLFNLTHNEYFFK